MREKISFRISGWPMRRKLCLYMLLLGALLLLTLVSGLFLFGRFDSAKASTAEALGLQMDFFEKDITSYFDTLAGSSIELSEHTVTLLEGYLEANDLAFHQLNDDPQAIAAIQEAMIGPLQQRLLQAHCSGVFVMLDAAVNVSIADAPRSRTCLYLQQSGYGADESVFLFRGLSAVGKAHDIALHRKWRLEQRTDLFPDYDEIRSGASLPLSEAYYLTELAVLPGTMDKAVLMTVPIVGTDGTFYGVCGYEVSASYFMSHHAQPAVLPHLTFLLTAGDERELDTTTGLSCGVYRGYYRAPTGLLSVQGEDHTLLRFVGEEVSYVGVTEAVALTPNNAPYTLSVMMLKSDFDRAVRGSILQNLILIALLLFFTVSYCLFFSRRYLQPILKGLEQIKSAQCADKRSSVPEINDLFAFLAEQDRQYEQSLHDLRMEKQSVERQYEQAQRVYGQAQREYLKAQEELSDAKTVVDRLAYARKSEIDPYDYEQFLTGIHELTKTEREIFEWYLAGKSAKDILEMAGIKEGTLKFHNHNILNKLGVSSRKQMLRYAALMKQQEQEAPATP